MNSSCLCCWTPQHTKLDTAPQWCRGEMSVYPSYQNNTIWSYEASDVMKKYFCSDADIRFGLQNVRQGEDKHASVKVSNGSMSQMDPPPFQPRVSWIPLHFTPGQMDPLSQMDGIFCHQPILVWWQKFLGYLILLWVVGTPFQNLLLPRRNLWFGTRCHLFLTRSFCQFCLNILLLINEIWQIWKEREKSS